MRARVFSAGGIVPFHTEPRAASAVERTNVFHYAEGAGDG